MRTKASARALQRPSSTAKTAFGIRAESAGGSSLKAVQWASARAGKPIRAQGETWVMPAESSRTKARLTSKASETLAERKKISVNLQPAVEQMLDEISEANGLKQSEVIQDAVKLLKFFTDEVASGRRLYTVDEQGENARELLRL